MDILTPTGWVTSALGDFCDLINGDRGKNYPSKDKLSASGFPFVNAGHLDAGSIQDEGMNYIDEARYDLLNSGKFTFGDILYCIRGSLGKLALNKNIEKGAIASSLIIIRPCQRTIPLFVFYYLKSPLARQMINKFDNGTAQPNLSGADLAKFVFPLPPLNEQKRIVAKIEELFSELDKGIESLKSAREQLKVYRQAVLKHAFEGKLTEQWRKDNADKLKSPEQLLARIQQERDTRYQQQLEDWKTAVKEWEINGKEGKKPGKPKKLAQLSSISETSMQALSKLPHGWSYIRLGHLIDEPAYGTSAKCDYDIGDQSVLRIPNISMGNIDDSDLKFASFDKGEIDHLRLMEGDILTIRSNGSISLVGSCALIKEKDTKHIFAGYLIRLRPNHSLVKSEYLLSAMYSHFLRGQIESAAKSTSGVNNINSGELQNLIIPLPSLREQEELISQLDSMLPLINATDSEICGQLAKAETLRQSILKKAFSGQLVPQDPNDEPASELLARIQAEKAALSAKAKKTPAKRGRKVKEVSE